MNKVIYPNETNGYLVPMVQLESRHIVHHGPNNCNSGKIHCRFCGVWRGDNLTVNTFYIISTNGAVISYGSMCKDIACAEKCKKDTEKYRKNYQFVQKLLNIEDRLQFITYIAACYHKKTYVPTNFTLLLKSMNTGHISTFLSTDRDVEKYPYSEQYYKDNKKYSKRYKQILHNIDKRLPLLTFLVVCHKKPTPNKFTYIIKVMGNKKLIHNRRISSFL